MTILYFAYGSNLDLTQMRERCPSARDVGIALLPGHRLAFSRFSKGRGCGVADAVPDAGRGVWGVLYEISARDLAALDKCEGYCEGRSRNAYERQEIAVLLNGDAGDPRQAETYFAVPQPNPPLPNQKYKSLILEGARRRGLPAYYVGELERIQVAGGPS